MKKNRKHFNDWHLSVVCKVLRSNVLLLGRNKREISMENHCFQLTENTTRINRLLRTPRVTVGPASCPALSPRLPWSREPLILFNKLDPLFCPAPLASSLCHGPAQALLSSQCGLAGALQHHSIFHRARSLFVPHLSPWLLPKLSPPLLLPKLSPPWPAAQAPSTASQVPHAGVAMRLVGVLQHSLVFGDSSCRRCNASLDGCWSCDATFDGAAGAAMWRSSGAAGCATQPRR